MLPLIKHNPNATPKEVYEEIKKAVINPYYSTHSYHRSSGMLKDIHEINLDVNSEPVTYITNTGIHLVNFGLPNKPDAPDADYKYILAGIALLAKVAELDLLLSPIFATQLLVDPENYVRVAYATAITAYNDMTVGRLLTDKYENKIVFIGLMKILLQDQIIKRMSETYLKIFLEMICVTDMKVTTWFEHFQTGKL